MKKAGKAKTQPKAQPTLDSFFASGKGSGGSPSAKRRSLESSQSDLDLPKDLLGWLDVSVAGPKPRERTECSCCRPYFDSLQLSPASRYARLQKVSRHKHCETPTKPPPLRVEPGGRARARGEGPVRALLGPASTALPKAASLHSAPLRRGSEAVDGSGRLRRTSTEEPPGTPKGAPPPPSLLRLTPKSVSSPAWSESSLLFASPDRAAPPSPILSAADSHGAPSPGSPPPFRDSQADLFAGPASPPSDASLQDIFDD